MCTTLSIVVQIVLDDWCCYDSVMTGAVMTGSDAPRSMLCEIVQLVHFTKYTSSEGAIFAIFWTHGIPEIPQVTLVAN